MASAAILRLHPPLCFSPGRPHSTLSTSFNPHLPNPNSYRRRYRPISASRPPPSWESEEESRWLREEQRWLREEQRWLREESRWNAERESLLREIAALREELERWRSSVDERTDRVEVLLRSLKERVVPPPVLVEEADVKEMVLEGSVQKEEVEEDEDEEEERKELMEGSKGEDVRVMQEALERLGFYSGEEDIEYSVFSSGTKRAVKSWQASLGVSEDGIMSSRLLQRLFSQINERGPELEEKSDYGDKDGRNGAPSVSDVSKAQQTVLKDSNNEDEVSLHRVFLLGENRWEEPSRLVSKDKLISTNTNISLVKCLTCRGEGRLMCTECDGTGEPNVEPQFLEWVGEGMKCPYCEGLGHTICDVCEGKTLVEKQQS